MVLFIKQIIILLFIQLSERITMLGSLLNQLFHINGRQVCLSFKLLYYMGLLKRVIVKQTITYEELGTTAEAYKNFEKCIREKLRSLGQELRLHHCESIDRINQIADLLKAAVDNELFSSAQLGFNGDATSIYDYAIENQEKLEHDFTKDFKLACQRQKKKGVFKFVDNQLINDLLPGFEIPNNDQTVEILDEEMYHNKKVKDCLNGEIIIFQPETIIAQTPIYSNTKNTITKTVDQVNLGEKSPDSLIGYSPEQILDNTN